MPTRPVKPSDDVISGTGKLQLSEEQLEVLTACSGRSVVPSLTCGMSVFSGQREVRGAFTDLWQVRFPLQQQQQVDECKVC